MKILIAAITLVIAAPAAAQTTPAQQHQGHEQSGQHQGHDPHGRMQAHPERGDCCADRNGNGRMDCCEHMAQAGDRPGCCCDEHAPQPAPQPQAHQGH